MTERLNSRRRSDGCTVHPSLCRRGFTPNPWLLQITDSHYSNRTSNGRIISTGSSAICRNTEKCRRAGRTDSGSQCGQFRQWLTGRSCLPHEHFQGTLSLRQVFQFQFTGLIADQFSRLGDSIGQRAKLIHQTDLFRLATRIDATSGQSFQLRIFHVSSGGSFLSELFVDAVEHPLHRFAFRI